MAVAILSIVIEIQGIGTCASPEYIYGEACCPPTTHRSTPASGGDRRDRLLF